MQSRSPGQTDDGDCSAAAQGVGNAAAASLVLPRSTSFCQPHTTEKKTEVSIGQSQQLKSIMPSGLS